MSAERRKIAFTVTASATSVFTVLSAGAFCNLTAFPIFDADSTGIIYIDGTDFSEIAKFGTVITDLIFRTAAAVIAAAAALVVTLAVWVIFGLTVIKKIFRCRQR